MPQQHRTRTQRVACLRLTPANSRESWEQLLATLAIYSPRVEVAETTASATFLYLDARGLCPLYPSEEAWCRAVLTAMPAPQAVLGLAGSKFAAWVACQSTPSSYLIVTQPDRTFLAPFPVTWLPLSAETQRRLHLLGLHTIGRFAALPPTAVAAQFGSDALTAHLWARGLDDRPVQGCPLRIFQASFTFPIPETRRDTLIAVALHLAQRALQDFSPLTPREASAWAIQRVELLAHTAEGATLQRSAWLGDSPSSPALQALFDRMLSSFQGRSIVGVTDLSVRLHGLVPAQPRQLSLFTYNATRHRLEASLRRLSQKHPPACFLCAQMGDLSSPLSAEHYTLRVYQP